MKIKLRRALLGTLALATLASCSTSQEYQEAKARSVFYRYDEKTTNRLIESFKKKYNDSCEDNSCVAEKKFVDYRNTLVNNALLSSPKETLFKFGELNHEMLLSSDQYCIKIATRASRDARITFMRTAEDGLIKRLMAFEASLINLSLDDPKMVSLSLTKKEKKQHMRDSVLAVGKILSKEDQYKMGAILLNPSESDPEELCWLEREVYSQLRNIDKETAIKGLRATIMRSASDKQPKKTKYMEEDQW